MIWLPTLALITLLVGGPWVAPAPAQLPLPAPILPDSPPFPPTVITDGGQRLLLDHTDVAVSYNRDTETLRANRAGWWIINFPLTRIEGVEEWSEDAIAQALFGRPAAQIKNWYLRIPGAPAAEPAPPTGPAPFVPHAEPTLVVNPAHPAAGDGNTGSAAAPLATIQAAVQRAQVGDVIQVHPGVYREAVNPGIAGTSTQPVVLEGLRGAGYQLPVVTGNTRPPAGAWAPVAGQPQVWRAENWANRISKLALAGNLLWERTIVAELADEQYCHVYANRELAFPRLDGIVNPAAGAQALGTTWSVQSVNADGELELGRQRGVFYLSTWVWVSPRRGWSPSEPQILSLEQKLDGEFRAGRQTGSAVGAQLNLYRFWLNGELLPAAARAGRARPHTDYGLNGDTWRRVPYREGWNHVVFLLDSTRRTQLDHTLRLRAPKDVGDIVSQAAQPTSPVSPGSGAPAPEVREWMVLGPLSLGAERPYETAVYLKLPLGRDPNLEEIDAGVLQTILDLDEPFWTVRGFEFRHGSQYQQNALTRVRAKGVTLEHNLFRESEIRTLSIAHSEWDLSDPPSVVRGNWFVSPGSLGIGASGNSDLLTAANQNTTAPGRGRALIEHNRVTDNNWSGYDRLWESGGMKFFRTTQWVIRQNTIIGGDGPGIWLDWEHYSNRLEGNYICDVPAFGIGVEASPGPHLLANNVTHDIRSGGAWFKYGLLAWSSARIWSVANTLDTYNGLLFSEGPDNRNTRWGALPERRAVVANSLILGNPVSMHRGRLGWVEGNRIYGPATSGLQSNTSWPDAAYGAQVEAGSQMGGNTSFPVFADASVPDYRYEGTHAAATAGVSSLTLATQGVLVDVVAPVRHDFYGLLRFPEDGVAAGAFRIEHAPAPAQTMQLELEFTDGGLERRWIPVFARPPSAEAVLN